MFAIKTENKKKKLKYHIFLKEHIFLKKPFHCSQQVWS